MTNEEKKSIIEKAINFAIRRKEHDKAKRLRLTLMRLIRAKEV